MTPFSINGTISMEISSERFTDPFPKRIALVGFQAVLDRGSK